MSDTPSEKEITKSNMVDTLLDFINQANRASLLDLYNQVYDTDYGLSDIDWDN